MIEQTKTSSKFVWDKLIYIDKYWTLPYCLSIRITLTIIRFDRPWQNKASLNSESRYKAGRVAVFSQILSCRSD